jgi:hypothetical protein
MVRSCHWRLKIHLNFVTELGWQMDVALQCAKPMTARCGVTIQVEH